LAAILVLSTMNGSWNSILQFEQLPDGWVGDPEGPQQQHWGAAELGLGLAGELVDGVDQLAGGPGVGVVGEVPDLARGVGVFAQHSEASPMSGM
jgi:hypothetical protein